MTTSPVALNFLQPPQIFYELPLILYDSMVKEGGSNKAFSILVTCLLSKHKTLQDACIFTHLEPRMT